MGDIVDVFVEGSWKERIFIKRGSDGSVICVTIPSEKDFQKGKAFDTFKWSDGSWRIKRYEPEHDEVVLVSTDGIEWCARHFAETRRNVTVCYIRGFSSITSGGKKADWLYMRMWE